MDKTARRLYVLRWTFAGALFGIFFMLVAWRLAVAETGPMTFAELHDSHPTMWVVDLAPSVLAAAGSVIGVLFARLAHAKARTEDIARQIAASWTADLHAANVELVEQLESRRRFHAAATHELRTPLATIVGYTGLAEEVASEPPELSAYLAEIYGAATAMILMVNDLLDAAKLESGGIPVQLTNVSGSDAIRDVAKRMMPLARQKDLEIAVDVEGEMMCQADVVRLRQVLTNVVANAIKYSNRGTISIHASSDAGGGAVIEVTDQGVGIRSEDLERIFGLFESGPNGAARRDSSGLGLAISVALMVAMGGSITARSDGTGLGATFRLALRAPGDGSTETRTAFLGAEPAAA